MCFFCYAFAHNLTINGGGTVCGAIEFNRITWYFAICMHSPRFSTIKWKYLSFLFPVRPCWFCPVYQPSLLSSPSWWFFLFSYTTAAVTVVTGVRDRRRRRRMKTAAQVTVTAGRRGGASAALRGWRWPPSHCAGEWKKSCFLTADRGWLLYLMEEVIFNTHMHKITSKITLF